MGGRASILDPASLTGTNPRKRDSLAKMRVDREGAILAAASGVRTLPGFLGASFGALLLSLLAGCAPGGSQMSAGDDAVDEEALRVCAKGATVQGVDVSSYQGTVNWAKVKASGRSFAITRVSDGIQYPDSKFATNWSGIRSAGLVRGVYQYFRASEDPTAQADYLVTQVGSLEPGDLAPVIDVETSDGVSNTTVVAGVHTWLARIKEKLGVDGIVYSASGFWNVLPNTASFGSNTLWVANYGASCPSMPSSWSHWSIWQYSAAGYVSGISGGTDLDEFNGTLTELQALTVQSTSPPPAPPPAAGCTTDTDCNGGAMGTAKVCDANGACVSGCHVEGDCPSGDTCDLSTTPGSCEANMPPPPPPPTGCPVLTFPSGINIQTVTNAAMTATYADHLSPGQTAPTCFIDVTNLHDPVTNQTYDTSVHVATNFQLEELVGTEVSQGWGNFVLVNPTAVEALQKFRDEIGGPVTINSGFRGPKHQESTCEGICGNPLGCAGDVRQQLAPHVGRRVRPADDFLQHDRHRARLSGRLQVHLPRVGHASPRRPEPGLRKLRHAIGLRGC